MENTCSNILGEKMNKKEFRKHVSDYWATYGLFGFAFFMAWVILK